MSKNDFVMGPARGNPSWDCAYDIVVVGAGAGGLPAAVAARDQGASVLLVEQNFDIGGRAILSGGALYLGGGNAHQKAEGIEDSPDRIYSDWTRADHPLGRYNDRELVRTYADTCIEAFDFLSANGVKWCSIPEPTRLETKAGRLGTVEWPNPFEVIIPGMQGSGLMRPLENAARSKGVEILLQHRMRAIIRESQFEGPVLGISVLEVDRHFQPTFRTLNIRARKAVIIATGGHSANVNFRRMFDPRLTEEYQVNGDNWSPKNADGEIAAMTIGAALWGGALQTNEADGQLSKGRIGCRTNYHLAPVPPQSPHFFREKASGLQVRDYQNVILVKENGQRFYNEMADVRDYEYFAAAMDWTGDPKKMNGGGPIWAIFDSDAVEREGWQVKPPSVDLNGYFFSANTLEDLAAAIRNKHQWRPMPGETLRETVARYNSFVDSGVDEDFNKPTPKYRIENGPFYAAWSTPVVHDVYVGLRTNSCSQVMDLWGDVIPGLYAAGESQGGIGQHGIARAVVFGIIAGKHSATSGDIGDPSRTTS